MSEENKQELNETLEQRLAAQEKRLEYVTKYIGGLTRTVVTLGNRVTELETENINQHDHIIRLQEQLQELLTITHLYGLFI